MRCISVPMKRVSSSWDMGTVSDEPGFTTCGLHSKSAYEVYSGYTFARMKCEATPITPPANIATMSRR